MACSESTETKFSASRSAISANSSDAQKTETRPPLPPSQEQDEIVSEPVQVGGSFLTCLINPHQQDVVLVHCGFKDETGAMTTVQDPGTLRVEGADQFVVMNSSILQTFHWDLLFAASTDLPSVKISIADPSPSTEAVPSQMIPDFLKDTLKQAEANEQIRHAIQEHSDDLGFELNVATKEEPKTTPEPEAPVELPEPELVAPEVEKLAEAVEQEQPKDPKPKTEYEVELIKNGSFEQMNEGFVPDEATSYFLTNEFPHWKIQWSDLTTCSEEPMFEIQTEKIYYNVDFKAKDLKYWMELDTNCPSGNHANVVLTQEVDTVPGVTYRLRFSYASRSSNEGADHLKVMFGTEVVFDDSIKHSIDTWTDVEVEFVASNGKTTLSLEDRGDPDQQGVLIDHISIMAIPPPSQP